MSNFEIGAPVRNTFKFEERPPESKQSRAAPVMLDKAIIGLATSYNEIHVSITGQTEIFAAGCFDDSLKSSRIVDLLVNHKADLKICDSSDRLELFSDRDGLWFRFWPTSVKRHQTIVDAVGDGTLAQMSVGYGVVAESFFKMRGVKHRLINRAVLGEISLTAAGAAAVKSTSAILVDGGDLRTNLSDDIKGDPYSTLRSRIKSCLF